MQQTHHRLRLLVREVGVLCRQSLADDAFYPAYLRHVVDALDARGGAIWTTAGDRQLRCRWQQSLSPATNNAALPDLDRRQSMALRAGQIRDGLVFRPGAAPGQHDAPWAIYMPLRRGEQTIAVMEVLKPAADERAARSWLRFAQHMALLASERPQPPANTATTAAHTANRLLALIHAVYESLGLDATAYNVVNEMRRFLECDRVSLIHLRPSGGQLLAISGQDTFDRRADVVRRLESLANSCRQEGGPLWFERETLAGSSVLPALPPGADTISDWNTLGILPLRPSHDDTAIGVLVVERMSLAASVDELSRRSQLALPHITRALTNASDHAAIPFISTLTAGGRLLRGDGALWKKRLIGLAALSAVVLFLAMFPVRFQVHGRGTLEPSVERDVFAELDGIVRSVHVDHGDLVQVGDVLAEMHNSDLEVQIAQIVGIQHAAREQLAAIQRQRHDPQTASDQRNRLASDALQLQEQLRGCDEQFALLAAKRERLVIRSPIAGQVVTWDVGLQLNQRPVNTGQVLMTIADPESPRELEVFLPEADIAHLAAAQAAAEQPLAVEYLAVTQPTVEHRGALRHVDQRAQLHEEHEHSVRLLVDVDRSDVPDAPAGTTVTARIDCGRRAIGYVWLHRLVGFVYSKILFRVG